MAEFTDGRAKLVRGRVSAVARDSDGFTLTLHTRATGDPTSVTADLAFDCTGFRPDLDQPLIRTLIERDLVCPDPHRLGLVVARNGRTIDGRGNSSPHLFAIGPLCQGTLWEITAVPEIVAQADAAAQEVALLADGQIEAAGQKPAETACS